MLALLVATPSLARAHAGDLRLAVEQGFATAHSAPQEDRVWGFFGAVSAGLGVARLAWVQFLVDYKRFEPTETAPESITAFALVLSYELDIGRFRPCLEVGVAYAQLGPTLIQGETQAFLPIIGGGVDFWLLPWLSAGAVARYYPLFESDLFNQPAYATFQVRLGVVFGARPNPRDG